MAFESISFTETDLEDAESLAILAAERVASKLRGNFGTAQYTTKSNERDWVTKWDKWAEDRIIKVIGGLSSDIGILCEEGATTGNSDVYWTVDPIDGTSHFVRGNELCTTMIALVDHGVPVVGLIYDFVRDIAYSAIAGKGAYRDQITKLSVSNRSLSSAYVEMYLDENTERGEKYRKAVEKTGAYIVRNASTGHTLSSVATGKTEGFVSLRNPFATKWDVAPGAIIIHEAGGIVRNIGKAAFNLSDPDFIAANPVVFDSLSYLAMNN